MKEHTLLLNNRTVTNVYADDSKIAVQDMKSLSSDKDFISCVEVFGEDLETSDIPYKMLSGKYIDSGVIVDIANAYEGLYKMYKSLSYDKDSYHEMAMYAPYNNDVEYKLLESMCVELLDVIKKQMLKVYDLI